MDKVDLFKKKFSILQDLSNAIVISDNVNSIANLLLDFAISYANAEMGSLMLVTDEDELSILASRGLDSQYDRSHKIKIGEGIAGTVAKGRLPVRVNDIETDPAFRRVRRDRYKTNSFISCPIIINNKLLGLLNINDKKDGTPFNDDEFELLKTLVNHAAVALENANLIGQLKSKAGELEAINKKLLETDILKTEFLTRVSHELRTPLNSLKGAIFYLQNTEKMELQERQEFEGIISSETDKLVSIVENLLDFLRLEDETRIIKKTVLNVGDIFRELQESKSLMAVLSRKGISLTVRTLDNRLDIVGDKIKVLQLFSNLIDGLSHYLQRGDTIEIGAAETRFVTFSIVLPRQLPASVISILHNTRYVFQIDQPEDRLKLHLARNILDTHRWKLSAANTDKDCRITLTVPTSAKQTIDVYVGQSMDSFVELISDLLDVDICSVMLSDELTNELTVKSAVGLDEDIVKRTRIKLGDKIAGWVALEGKPLLIEDIESDTRFAKTNISQYTTKSLMTLPLKVGDRVVGVLNLNNKKTAEPFSEGDYHVASQMSDKISHFIELLQSETFDEKDFKQFVASLGDMLDADDAYHAKRDILSTFADKILKNSKPLIKLKKNTQPAGHS
ncbi:MAG TPA: GAF domain-containing protein [Nitrospirota bacterium]|nr:GAF domain-containing protein [Nitrospirota bacterium]